MNKRKARLDLSKMVVTTKISRLRNILTRMQTMPILATPPAPFALVSTLIDELETAFNLAQTGNKAAIQQVYIKVRQLDMYARSYRDYVTLATNGDAALIVEAGFDLVRLPTPVGELPAPANGRVMFTDKANEGVIRWNRVKGASSYVVQYRYETATPPKPPVGDTNEPPVNTNEGDDWQAGALTQTANATIKGLKSATYYWMRVAANGASGLSGWSDPIRILIK
jgi:hypothetical protein